MPETLPVDGKEGWLRKTLSWVNQNQLWAGSGAAALAVVGWVVLVESGKGPTTAPELAENLAFPNRPALDSLSVPERSGRPSRSDSFSYIGQSDSEQSNSPEAKEAADGSGWKPYPGRAPGAKRERDSAGPSEDRDGPSWDLPRASLPSARKSRMSLGGGMGGGSASAGASPATGGYNPSGTFGISPEGSGSVGGSGLLSSIKGFFFRTASKPQDPKSRARAAAGGAVSKPAGLQPARGGSSRTSTQPAGAGAIQPSSSAGASGPAGAGLSGGVAPDTAGGGGGAAAPAPGGGVGGMVSASQGKAQEDSGKALDCEDQGGEWDSAKGRCDMSGKRRKECDLEGGDYDSKTKLCDRTGSKRALCEADYGHIWDYQTKQCLKDKEAIIEEKDCGARKGLWVIEPSPNCRCAPPNEWLRGVDGVDYCMNPKDATVLDQEKCKDRGGTWFEGEKKPCQCPPSKDWETTKDGLMWCLSPGEAATPDQKSCEKRDGEWFEGDADPCQCPPPKDWAVQGGKKWCRDVGQEKGQKCTVQSLHANPSDHPGACLKFTCKEDSSKVCHVPKDSLDCGTLQEGNEKSECPQAPCPSTISKVCGADGKTYNSACKASQAGTTVAKEKPCEEGSGRGEIRVQDTCKVEPGKAYCKDVWVRWSASDTPAAQLILKDATGSQSLGCALKSSAYINNVQQDKPSTLILYGAPKCGAGSEGPKDANILATAEVQAVNPCAGKIDRTTGLCYSSNFWCWKENCKKSVTCETCKKVNTEGTGCVLVDPGEQGDTAPCPSGKTCQWGPRYSSMVCR